jgi:hypothetical protein
MRLCINFVLLLYLRFGIYLHLVTANKILTNWLKAMLSFNPCCWLALHITWILIFGEFMPTGFPTTCWAMIMCELILAVSHPPQEKNMWFRRSHKARSLIWSRWRFPVDLRQGWSLVCFIIIFYFVIRLPLCNKYSDVIVTFISIPLCYYICRLLGACMRCTWLCPLKPECDRALEIVEFIIRKC